MSKLIALDDGHGMETAGKRTPKLSDGTFMHENEFNSAVVTYCAKVLEACGMDVLFTAPTDVDVPLSTRVQLANVKGADIFVSVHANANTGKWNNANGVETYYYASSKEGKKLANAVHSQLIKGTKQTDRGIKTQTYYVLKNTKMPAILVEAGFMDNKTEAELLKSDTFRRECANEIAHGICDYYGTQFIDGVLSLNTSKTLYKVQVGAFSKKENARKLLADLDKLGYQAIVVTSNKLYKVQVGSFSVKENATKLMAQLKTHGYSAVIVS